MSTLTVNQVDVARLNVAADEVVLVTCAGILSQDQAGRIKSAFASAFEATGGEVPPILVVSGGLKVDVVRRSDLALQIDTAG